jgi:hypothetical protein
MFVSEPKLFFIGTINLPLDVENAIIVNTIQIEKKIDTVNFAIKPTLNHRGSSKIVVNKKNVKQFLKTRCILRLTITAILVKYRLRRHQQRTKYMMDLN